MRLLVSVFVMLFVCGSNHPAAASTAAAKTKAKQPHAPAAMHPALTADSALVIASAKVPHGRLKSHELEREHGHLIYSFDFVVPGKPGIEEVNVDAMSGAVLAVEHEGPRAERRETAQERREAAKPKAGH